MRPTPANYCNPGLQLTTPAWWRGALPRRLLSWQSAKRTAPSSRNTVPDCMKPAAGPVRVHSGRSLIVPTRQVADDAAVRMVPPIHAARIKRPLARQEGRDALETGKVSE